MANDKINIIVAVINDKPTVLYDEEENIDKILDEINNEFGLSNPAYIKSINRKKYNDAKDNMTLLNEIIT